MLWKCSARFWKEVHVQQTGFSSSDFFQIVNECNESARSMERMEEMLILSQQLDFREVRAVPLISASRWLVKKGEVVRSVGRNLTICSRYWELFIMVRSSLNNRIWWKENAEAKLTFGRRMNRQTLCLFLFTDLLVITRRKRWASAQPRRPVQKRGNDDNFCLCFSDENYLVVDHCPRNLVTLSELDSTDRIPGGGKYLSGGESPANLAWITLLQNHEHKTLEWLVSFRFERARYQTYARSS